MRCITLSDAVAAVTGAAILIARCGSPHANSRLRLLLSTLPLFAAAALLVLSNLLLPRPCSGNPWILTTAALSSLFYRGAIDILQVRLRACVIVCSLTSLATAVAALPLPRWQQHNAHDDDELAPLADQSHAIFYRHRPLLAPPVQLLVSLLLLQGNALPTASVSVWASAFNATSLPTGNPAALAAVFAAQGDGVLLRIRSHVLSVGLHLNEQLDRVSSAFTVRLDCIIAAVAVPQPSPAAVARGRLKTQIRCLLLELTSS